MKTFGQILRDARKVERKKLREISSATGLSISHLSDIEHGRKNPPQSTIINKLEKLLGIDNKALIAAAKKEVNMSSTMRDLFKKRPALNLGLLRVTEGMSDEELSEVIRKLQSGQEASEDSEHT